MLLGNWTRRLFVGRNAAFPPSINDLCNKMVSNGLAQDLCVPFVRRCGKFRAQAFDVHQF
jgi:hypothetical protein